MEKSVKSEIYFYLQGVKSLSQLHRAIVKNLTHGNVFLWLGESDEKEKIAQAKEDAERLATEMINRNLHAIPSRIKRDM